MLGAVWVFDWLVRWGWAVIAAGLGGGVTLIAAAYKAGGTFKAIRADTERIDHKIGELDGRIVAAEARVSTFEAEWRDEVRRLGDKMDSNHGQVVTLLTNLLTKLLSIGRGE